MADVDVSDESDSEPTRKRTASRRVVNLSAQLKMQKRSCKVSLCYSMQGLCTESVPSQHGKKTIRGLDESTSSLLPSSEENWYLTRFFQMRSKVYAHLKENVILEWGSEQESEYSEEDLGDDDEEVDWIDSDKDEEKKDDTDDDKSIDLEMTDDEFVHEISDVAKVDAEKIEEIKDDAKKAELPPTSSDLSVSSVPMVVEHYPRSKISDDLQIVLQRHTADLIQKYSMKTASESIKTQKPIIDLKQEYEKSTLEIRRIKREQVEKKKMPKYTIKFTDKATLKEYDQKALSAKPCTKTKDENTMDTGVADIVKNHKRQHNDDDDEDPSTGPNQGKKTKRRRTKECESSKKTSTTKETSKGKALTKSSKTGKSAYAKEPVEEPIAEVVIDDAVHTVGEDVVGDDDQPQDTYKPKKTRSPNHDWFNQSKGYRVYNKRTRLIVESIHIKFDEIKEMTFEHSSSSLGRQCQMVSAENNTSGPVPQCSKDV
ncbi:hypothetical protein Tco_0492332 [Tanacetum coccineum]